MIVVIAVHYVENVRALNPIIKGIASHKSFLQMELEVEEIDMGWLQILSVRRLLPGQVGLRIKQRTKNQPGTGLSSIS